MFMSKLLCEHLLSILLVSSLMNDSLVGSLPSGFRRLSLCVLGVQCCCSEVQSHSESWSFMWASLYAGSFVRGLCCVTMRCVGVGLFPSLVLGSQGPLQWRNPCQSEGIFLDYLFGFLPPFPLFSFWIYWTGYLKSFILFSHSAYIFWLYFLGDFLKFIFWYFGGVSYIWNQTLHFPELFCSLNIHIYTFDGVL